MPKTTKKKPMSKAVAAALKAMENMTFETADLDVQLNQLTERLNAAGVQGGLATISLAGRNRNGSGAVTINMVGGSGSFSAWPEWAYEIAADALHFNKQVYVVYNDGSQPDGLSLIDVHCTNISA